MVKLVPVTRSHRRDRPVFRGLVRTFFIFLLFAVSDADAAASKWQAPTEGEIEARLELSAKHKSVGKRVDVVSQAFVGAPYQLSPLGEGEGVLPDVDPRLRFDAFDCTTFVETSIALALAGNLDEARGLLDVLRYRNGEVDFLQRRHFPAAEWIPELTHMGFLRDVTRYVGGKDVVVERKILNPQVWERRKTPTMLELPTTRIPNGIFSLPVLPLDKAPRYAERIPNGTVLNVVRVNFKNVPVRVSHQGIVIVQGKKRFLRHAADRMYHSVVDEPLDAFFARMAAYKRWPVRGIHLSRIVEPANWRELLHAPQKTTAVLDWVSAPGYADGVEQMTLDPALQDLERCMEASNAFCRAEQQAPAAASLDRAPVDLEIRSALDTQKPAARSASVGVVPSAESP